MKDNAILLTAGILARSGAKTAHGLIRKTSRYQTIGVIDSNFAGQDAGYVLDKIDRNIPVYASVADFQQQSAKKAGVAIVGVAFPGGKLPPAILTQIKDAIRAVISIVSGAHDFLSDIPEILQLAEQYGVTRLDIRKPR